MNGYAARLMDDTGTWSKNTILLVVREQRGNYSAYLMRDGTWREADEGLTMPPDFGIELPRAAIEAIATAIQEWQGHTSHADTEARVLREWLAVERERVDASLRRLGARP